jgi:acyl transferase domain-containing protein
LQVSWEALEDAGIVPETLRGGNTGVYVGMGMLDYQLFYADQYDYINAYTHTGCAHSVAANRISFFFNLRGPSLATDTACASSVTAAHLACTAMWTGECDLTLVCGANVLLEPGMTVGFAALGVLSSEGRAKVSFKLFSSLSFFLFIGVFRCLVFLLYLLYFFHFYISLGILHFPLAFLASLPL